MKLYVWQEFFPDYSNGLAFAIAESIEQAQQLVIAAFGFEFDSRLWGSVSEFDLSSPVAFAVAGGQ